MECLVLFWQNQDTLTYKDEKANYKNSSSIAIAIANWIRAWQKHPKKLQNYLIFEKNLVKFNVFIFLWFYFISYKSVFDHMLHFFNYIKHYVTIPTLFLGFNIRISELIKQMEVLIYMDYPSKRFYCSDWPQIDAVNYIWFTHHPHPPQTLYCCCSC